MNMTLLNIVLLTNALFVFFLEKFRLKAPVTQLLGLISVVVYTVFLAPSLELANMIWPAALASALFFINEMGTANECDRIHPTLATGLGFSPILLVEAPGIFTLGIYLLTLELFKLVVDWPRNIDEAKKVARLSVSDSFKVVTIILVLILSVFGLDSLNLANVEYVGGKPAIALALTLPFLALLYLGIFESGKQQERRCNDDVQKNPFWARITYRTVVPVLAILFSKTLLNGMEFAQYLVAQKAILLLMGAGIIVTLGLSIRRPTFLGAYSNLFFFVSAGIFYINDKFTSFHFTSTVLIAEALILLLRWDIKALLNEKLKQILTFVTLPTPFSPLLWTLVVFLLGYEGVLKEELFAFSFISIGVGVFTFAKNKDQLILLDKQSLSPISFIGLTLLTVFLSVLFIATMVL